MIVTQDQVWGAAAYAYRTNHEIYVTIEQSDSGIKPNKVIALDQLLTGLPDVTESDVVFGIEVRKTVSRHLTYSILADEFISEWDRRAGEIVLVESWEFEPVNSGPNRKAFWEAKYQISMICALFKKYKQLNEQAKVADRLNYGYVAEVGERVAADVEIIVCNYSHKYNTHFVTGITEKQQLVFFSHRAPPTVGSKTQVRGTVKRHTHSKEYAADLTQLTRVRITT